MKTGAEYLEDLRKIERNVYVLGEKVTNILENPVINPTLKALKAGFDLAENSQHSKWMTATSSLINKKINRFNHIMGSVEDCVQRIVQNRKFQNNVGSCAVRCTGCAALNALYATTYEMDQKNGTSYHQRFVEFVKYVQENDLCVGSGMMDVKGDRSRGPAEQEYDDLFLKVVAEREDGIVVRGAKAHQTGAVMTHETIVVPSRLMTGKDKAYAVAFAIPSNAPGITHIYQHNFADARYTLAEDIDKGGSFSCSFGGTTLMVFDNVFVPKERIFMMGEYDFTRLLLRRFAILARMWEGGCRPGIFDLLIGAGAAIAEYNGVPKASHIREKLTDIAIMSESIFATAIAACYYAQASPAGVYFPDQMLCANSKLYSIHSYYEAIKLINDIAGGLVMTMPSEQDLKHPEVGKYLQHYLKGAPHIATEDRMRMFRFIEALTAGPVACALHFGGGTIEAQRITIWQATAVEDKKKMAERLAGVNLG